MECDASGQRLRHLPHEVRGSAPEQQKARGRIGPVQQHPQHGEELGSALDLIENHQAAKGSEHQLGVLQCGGVGGIFEIKNVALGEAGEFSGEGGFPCLPWAEESHGGGALEIALN